MQIQAIKILNGNNGSQVIKVGTPMDCPDGECRGVLKIEGLVDGSYVVTCEEGTRVDIDVQNIMVQYYSA